MFPIRLDKVQQTAVELLAIQGSDAWQAEREAAIEAANVARSEAASAGLVGRAAAKAKDDVTQSLDDPQGEGQLNAPEETPKRDHAKKHAQSAAAIAAQRIGVSRATVERVTTVG